MDSEYWMGRTVCSKALQLTYEDLEKIYWVTEFIRNDLVRFIPKIKVLDIDYLKECLIVILESIEFLISDSNSIIGFSIISHSSVREAIIEIK